MEAGFERKPEAARATELNEAIGRRAREIYEESGRIAGRDVENWIKAEAEIQSGQKGTARKSAVVVRVDGVQYVGEYRPGLAEGYTPGEFAKGDPVPVRFDGNQMFVKRHNGKELATRLVSHAG